MQGELEDAWTRITGSRERFTLAGRTDAGVHARGQVASVVTAAGGSPAQLTSSLVRALPEDLRLVSLEEAPSGFDARRSAHWRAYGYELAAGRKEYLRLSAMNDAARGLEGERDFAAFSSVGGVAGGSRGAVRRLMSLRVERSRRGEGYAFTVVADAFLRQMVRRLVSALVAVGRGKITGNDVLRAGEMKDRTLLPGPAPAANLTLLEIGYGE